MPLSSLSSLFSSSVNQYFFDIADYAVTGAKAAFSETGFVIHQLFSKEGKLPFEGLKDVLKQVIPMPKSNLIEAHCGVYPKNTFIHTFTLDNPSQSREENFFQNILRDKFNVDLSATSVGVLNGNDGNDYSIGTPAKEVIFMGADTKQLEAEQDKIKDSGIYPTTLECPSFSVVGATAHYLQHNKLVDPTIVLDFNQVEVRILVFKGGLLSLVKTIPYGYDYFADLIQKKLSLKDIDAGRQSISSPKSDLLPLSIFLVGDLVKELASFISLYELDSGVSLKTLMVLGVPITLNWMAEVVAKPLRLAVHTIDMQNWAKCCNIALHKSLQSTSISQTYINLFALMAAYKN